MGPLLARKKRISLVVEFLEDRQLLSHPGSSPSSWDLSAQEVATQTNQPAPIWGSMDATGGRADADRPGPMSVSGSVDGPATVLVLRSDGPSIATGPTRDCPTPSPTVTLEILGIAPGPGHDRLSADGAGPAGNLPPGGGASSPSPPFANGNGGAPAPGSDDHGPNRAPTPSNVSAEATGNPPPRGGSTGPSPDFVLTSRVEPTAPAGPGQSGIEILPVPSTVTLAVPNPAIGVQGHGATPIEIIDGQGSVGGPPRVALDDGTARGFSGARPPADSPHNSEWEDGGTEVGSGVVEIAATRPGERFEAPDPQTADMITSLLPFDRSTMEAAIDQVLGPIDGLASSMPGLRGPMRLVTASLAVAVTVLTVDLAIRVRRSRGEEVELDGDGDEAFVAFPGLPGVRRWSRP